MNDRLLKCATANIAMAKKEIDSFYRKHQEEIDRDSKSKTLLEDITMFLTGSEARCKVIINHLNIDGE